MTDPSDASPSPPSSSLAPVAPATEDDSLTPEERARALREHVAALQRAWMPTYLSDLVVPYCEDVWCTPLFDPRLVAQLMAEGFLPIASREALLPKLHAERCVVRWPDLHTSRNVRRRARRYRVTVDADFDGVVRGCRARHGEAWLYPRIVEAFRRIHDAGRDGGPGVEAVVVSRRDGAVTGRRAVRLHSTELRREEDDDGETTIVAGELGYTVGDVYTSLTGFSDEDGAGSAQLAATGALLRRRGFRLWDLGMWLDYKERLGARLTPRAEFVEEIRRAREEGPDPRLECPTEGLNVGDLLKEEQNNDAVAPKQKKKQKKPKQKKPKKQTSKSPPEPSKETLATTNSTTTTTTNDEDDRTSSSDPLPDTTTVEVPTTPPTDESSPPNILTKRSREISPVSVQSLPRPRSEEAEAEAKSK